jgi:hypothetical protein
MEIIRAFFTLYKSHLLSLWWTVLIVSFSNFQILKLFSPWNKLSFRVKIIDLILLPLIWYLIFPVLTVFSNQIPQFYKETDELIALGLVYYTGICSVPMYVIQKDLFRIRIEKFKSKGRSKQVKLYIFEDAKLIIRLIAFHAILFVIAFFSPYWGIFILAITYAVFFGF